jgi:hypothetical protein
MYLNKSYINNWRVPIKNCGILNPFPYHEKWIRIEVDSIWLSLLLFHLTVFYHVLGLFITLQNFDLIWCLHLRENNNFLVRSSDKISVSIHIGISYLPFVRIEFFLLNFLSFRFYWSENSSVGVAIDYLSQVGFFCYRFETGSTSKPGLSDLISFYCGDCCCIVYSYFNIFLSSSSFFYLIFFSIQKYL